MITQQAFLFIRHLYYVKNILFLFYLSVLTIFRNDKRSITVNDLPVQFLSLFKELVTDCLYIAESSLLQIFITMCERFFKRHENSQQFLFISLILQCLLIWGGDAINQPNENDKGNRLLHKSVSLSCSAFRLPLT